MHGFVCMHDACARLRVSVYICMECDGCVFTVVCSRLRVPRGGLSAVL